ncbi:hypothetical protein Droror1_Dr00012232 [Drosera rotundifolia]
MTTVGTSDVVVFSGCGGVLVVGCRWIKVGACGWFGDDSPNIGAAQFHLRIQPSSSPFSSTLNTATQHQLQDPQSNAAAALNSATQSTCQLAPSQQTLSPQLVCIRRENKILIRRESGREAARRKEKNVEEKTWQGGEENQSGGDCLWTSSSAANALRFVITGDDWNLRHGRFLRLWWCFGGWVKPLVLSTIAVTRAAPFTPPWRIGVVRKVVEFNLPIRGETSKLIPRRS